MRIAGIALPGSLPLVWQLFSRRTPEQLFWKWFEANQAAIYHFENDREEIFDRLAATLNEVHEDLTFEIGPIRADGTRQFVISAGGVKSAFPWVEALFETAPKFPKWEFVKYRQRRSPINDLAFADKEVKATDVHYAIFKDEDRDKIGVMIFLDGYSGEGERDVWRQIGYLLLDDALGEYDVETHVGAIGFFNRSSPYFEQARPLQELPSHFDRTIGRQP